MLHFCENAIYGEISIVYDSDAHETAFGSMILMLNRTLYFMIP